MEEWKTINGYPDYAISVGGQVKSLRFNRLLTPSLSNNSYLYVNLVENKRKKTTAIHRLVIDHFGPTCPDLKLVVDHKDGNKTNNHISNLGWVTIKENTLRGYGNQDKKIKVLELRQQGMTIKKIAEAVSMSASFVQDTINGL